MKRATLILAILVLLLGGVGQARSDIISTFDLAWSGAPNGNTAVATGTITLDLSLLHNPGVTQAFLTTFSALVQDLSITVSGAPTEVDGTFTEGDYIGIYLDTNGVFLDFTKELVGQPTIGFPWGTTQDGTSGQLTLFGVKANTPGDGGGDFQLEASGFRMNLTSFAPASAPVPEPSSLVLLCIGIAVLAGIGLRRRKLAAA